MLNNQSQFNGNVLIIDDGVEILKKSYGLANRTSNEKLDEDSVFELASVSKQFTATGIIILKQQGQLNYTDKVTLYFPELEFCSDVTIENLLNHTSGIPDYMSLIINNWNKEKTATNKDVVLELAERVDSLDFSPNERFDYSNSNYVLLASIIEKVANQSYADFMKENIFTPLGMIRSSVLNRRYKNVTIENYAYGYVQGERQEVALPDSLGYLQYVIYLDGIVGDGMVNSTVNDLRIWDESLRSNAIISKKEFDYLLHRNTLNNGEINDYSFGWNIKQTEDGLSMSHSGSWPGYVTYLSRGVEEEDLIVILQNFDEIVLPVKAINEILNNEPISQTYRQEIKVSNVLLESLAGEYLDEEDGESVTTLTVGENALIFNATNTPWNLPFYPDSESTFFSKAPRMTLGFDFREENGAKKLIFLQNGKKVGMSVKKN